jgi:hypothetical protein
MEEYMYDPDCSTEAFEACAASLKRWSERTKNHVVHARQFERHEFPKWIVVKTLDEDSLDGSAATFVFHLMARNLSQAGMSILLPEQFVPRLLCDRTPLMRSESRFRKGEQLFVNLVSRAGDELNLQAQIVRLRPLPQGFWEAGLRFVARS